MAVYRFRICFEDNEEIYREIDIKSTQNFEDFHNVIVQSIGFDNLHDASFFISDDYWRKGDEITLRPISDHEKESRELKKLAPKKQMNKCKMAALIDDPHQKFVYIYDLKTGWTFLIELLKIVADDPKVNYPKCVKSVGDAPKQHKTIAPSSSVDDEDEFFDDDEEHGDDEAYASAHSEDETALLEGEEGEEETTEEEEMTEDDDFGASEFDDNEHFEEGKEDF